MSSYPEHRSHKRKPQGARKVKRLPVPTNNIAPPNKLPEVQTMKKSSTRTRHVFPTTEIAHLWASGKVTDARNPQGNLHFEGGTLTSYSTDIAKVVTHKGAKAALFLTRDVDGDGQRKWSHTTSGQLSDAQRAVNHFPRFAVADIGAYNSTPNHKLNRRAYDNCIAYCNAKATRARVNGSTWASEARSIEAEAQAYATFFGLATFKPTAKAAEDIEAYFTQQTAAAKRQRANAKLDKARRAQWHAEQAAQWEANAPAREAARLERERTEAEIRERRRITLPRRIDEWHSGGFVQWTNDFPETLLRVAPHSGDYYPKEAEIETSQGARVPYAAAKRLYLAWVRNEARHGDEVGHYTVLSVNGNIKIGCHVISRAEADRLAAAEGWAEVPANT